MVRNDVAGADGGRQSREGDLRLTICWALFFVWIVLHVASMLAPNPLLGLAILILPVIVLIQGSILYGWRGILCYLAIGVTVGFLLEASSVANGFPFGSYTHNVAGPKPAGVAIQAIVAYALTGWFALLIGKVLVLDGPHGRQRYGRIVVPLVAAFVIAGLDLPHDPLGATIKKDWTFAHPSGLYGVPLTNLLGWLFTGYVLFQIFVLIEHRFRPAPASDKRSFWALPCLVWLGMALPFPLGWPGASLETVVSGDRTYVIADIFEGGIMVSLFSMVLLALLALNKLYLGGWKSSREAA